MSVSFRQHLRELHSSVGLVIGWIGFFLFLFGSLALYRSEITFWLQPETHEAALPHTGIEEKVRAARSGLDYLASRAPGESMWRIVLPTERMPLPGSGMGLWGGGACPPRAWPPNISIRKTAARWRRALRAAGHSCIGSTSTFLGWTGVRAAA